MVESKIFKKEFEIRVDTTANVENSISLVETQSNIKSDDFAYINNVTLNIVEDGTASGDTAVRSDTFFKFELFAELTNGSITRNLDSYLIVDDNQPQTSIDAGDFSNVSKEISTYLEGGLDINATHFIDGDRFSWDGSNTDELLVRFEVLLLGRIP